MRTLGAGLAGCVAVAAIALTARGSGMPTLPLRSPPPATSKLLAIVSEGNGWSQLVQLDPATFAVERRAGVLGSYGGGWVRSPDGRLLAIAASPSNSDGTVSTVRFANAATLGVARQGVRLDGYFISAIWPRDRTLYALTGDCCDAGLTLDTIDTIAKKIVARTSLAGPVVAVARSASGLVTLAAGDNAIVPARLLAIGPDGDVRTVWLDRILAGTHFDQSSQDPVGDTRQPGLAVDPAAGVAYVVDPNGLVAAVRLDDLTVGYHQTTGQSSLLARLSRWLTPPAQAKGLNGPLLTAQWLGDGLIAVAGSDYATAKERDGSLAFAASPAGLRIVDVDDWTVRTLDPQADSALVADGVLLTSGSSWRSDPHGTTGSGEGVAAYGPDGALRWRLDPGQRLLLSAAYGDRALVQAVPTDSSSQQPLQLVDLTTGRVLRSLPASSYPWLLLGDGS